MIRRLTVAGLIGCMLGIAAAAGAQTQAPKSGGGGSLGIGPRFSFVRGSITNGTPTTRLVGGTLRIVTGPHTALEGSLDYRAYTNDAGTERVREKPIQGSMLLFIARSALSP